MSAWNYEEYLNKQIRKIEDLKANGYSTRDILDKNEFCFEALKTCGLPITYLVPRADSQKMTVQEWDTHTSNEHKWEFNGIPFLDADKRDRVMLGLIYSSGLKHLLNILPLESREELAKLINNNKE